MILTCETENGGMHDSERHHACVGSILSGYGMAGLPALETCSLVDTASGSQTIQLHIVHELLADLALTHSSAALASTSAGCGRRGCVCAIYL